MIESTDNAILRFVQKWIADPLQFSGFDLDWQIYGALILSTLGVIWNFTCVARSGKWFDIPGDCILIVLYTFAIIHGELGVVCINEAWVRLLVTVLTSYNIGYATCHNGSAADYSDLIWSVGLWFFLYLNNCEPKPPAGDYQTQTSHG